MKSGIVALLLLMTCALTVHAAGHGTIEETEAAIIVEYTGDAKDLPVEKSTPEVAGLAGKAPSVELQAATPAVDPPVPTKADMSAREARANMSEAQRQKREVRATQQAARQQRLGGASRQPRSESVE